MGPERTENSGTNVNCVRLMLFCMGLKKGYFQTMHKGVIMSKMNGNIRYLGLIVIVFISTIGWITTPTRLKFGNDILKDLPTMFGYLILVSLFVERAIEVFLSAWRSQGADELDFEITNKQKHIKENIDLSANKPNETDQIYEIIKVLKKDLEILEKERTVYSSDSRFIAQWLGLSIGVLVSLVGVRVFGNIVDISSLSNKQTGSFTVVDIILTGAVLAGGSEAINKIMKIYNGLMSTTAKKVTS